MADLTKTMLEPEFHPSFSAWKADPGPHTLGPLLKDLNPVLNSALRTYGGGSPSPTLATRAKLLTLDALPRYDPGRAKLRTHLMVHLQGLRRYAAKENQIIGIPERVGLDLYRVNQAHTELSDKLGRPPTDIELADHTGLSRKRITYVRKSKPGLAEGSLTQEGEGGTDLYNPAIRDTSDDAWREFVLHDLSPQDQLILEHSVGLNGKPVLSKQQIAAKLRLSPGAISQRAARIQAMLDKKEDLGVTYL